MKFLNERIEDAAPRIARADEQLAELKLQVIEMARDIHKANVLRNSAEAKVAQLERERAAFIERTRIAEADKVAEYALSEARERAIQGCMEIADAVELQNRAGAAMAGQIYERLKLLAGASGAAGKGEDNG